MGVKLKYCRPCTYSTHTAAVEVNIRTDRRRYPSTPPPSLSTSEKPFRSMPRLGLESDVEQILPESGPTNVARSSTMGGARPSRSTPTPSTRDVRTACSPSVDHFNSMLIESLPGERLCRPLRSPMGATPQMLRVTTWKSRPTHWLCSPHSSSSARTPANGPM